MFTLVAGITQLELNGFRPTKGNRTSWAARNMLDRSGLVALGSLLVAMEDDRSFFGNKE